MRPRDWIHYARYLIERTFPDGLGLTPNPEGRDIANRVIANNAQQGVTWIHSYVTPDRKRTFCIYDAPSWPVTLESGL